MSNQIDKDCNSYEHSDYNVMKFNEQIKKRRWIIRYYEILKLFYNNDGSLKNERELLESYFKVKNEVEISIFYEFFINVYNDGISNIQLPEYLQKEKYNIVYKLFKEEIQKNKTLARLILEQERKYIFIKRDVFFEKKYNMYMNSTNRLKHYLNFLEKNNKLVLDTNIEELKTMFHQIDKIKNANDIFINASTLNEYEMIKKKSINGDEICSLVVSWVENEIHIIQNGALMTQNKLVKAVLDSKKVFNNNSNEKNVFFEKEQTGLKK